MRLIDADKLIEAINNHFDSLDAYFPSKFIEEVNDAPTVAEAGRIEDGITLNPMTEEEIKKFSEMWCNVSVRADMRSDAEEAAEEAIKEAHYLDDDEDTIAGRWHS